MAANFTFTVGPGTPAGPVTVIYSLSGVNAANYATPSSGSILVGAPTPAVAGVSPNTGSTAGGTSVTITGTNFTGATAVSFGGVNATSFTVNSATSISATTPAGVTGPVAVAVTTPGGTGSLGGAFTYVTPVPTVTGASPNSGSTAGGTSVTITGTGFAGATAVSFGGTAATSFTVNSATSITATTPAHAAGAVAVAVTTPGGTNSLTNAFTYVTPAPTVTSVNPSIGPLAGGTPVTITGTDLTGATAVSFGGVLAASFTVNNATSITATTPAGSAGAVTVSVTTLGGIGSLANGFTYTALPTVTAASPNSGPVAGGTSVTITGANLAGTTAVSFGGVAAASFTVNSPSSITATTAAHAAGSVDIVVTTPGGTGTLVGGFTYAAAATVTAAAPNTGPTAGGTVVTLTGTSLTGATAVSFGGVAATSFMVVSPTSITATAPAHAAGAVAVSVTTPSGTGTLANGFTYAVAAPTVTAAAPNTGPAIGGTAVTITGTNFTGATAVSFGGVAATSFTVVSATSITATTPAHAAGAVAVSVTAPSGTGSLANGFTYSVAAPTVTAVAPNSGPVAGGTAVTITGTNFTGASAVAFGGVGATSFTVVSTSSITATAPAGTAGAVAISVSTPSGTSSLANGFTYAGTAPTVTAVSPNSGLASGGTKVTITGTNLTGATAVTFGGAAASFSVASTTSITATTPAGSPGTVAVVVSTPNGAASGSFSYISTATTTTIGSSANPSQARQAVTFTARVSSSGGSPVGSVAFRDGDTVIGESALSGGVATLTTAGLALGSHIITATFSSTNGFAASTSPALTQIVEKPADSVRLRALQVAATKVIAQNSGAAISNMIDMAIAEALGDGGQLISPTANGVRINLGGDWGQAGGGTAGPPMSSSSAHPVLGALGYASSDDSRSASRFGTRMNDAFSSLGRQPSFTQARQKILPDWLIWADIKGSGLTRPDSVVTRLSALHGNQLNAMAGLSYRVTPDFIVGMTGGYESFHYTSETLNGRLRGDGWTVGSYLGWRITPLLRFDAATTYTRLDYDGRAGTAAGSFDGNRLMLSAGLTGSLKFDAFTLEPSARVFGIWERQDAYTDTLGTRQDSHTLFTGRASVGARLSYAWEYSSSLTLRPSLGLYADSYFTSDNDNAGALVPAASVPLLTGVSARITGGIAASFGKGSALSFDGEYGGIGGNQQIWSFRARASSSF